MTLFLTMAWAAEPEGARDGLAEEWVDGLTLRPVRSPAVVFDGLGATGGPTRPVFGALSVQYGAPMDGGVSLGVALEARALDVASATGRQTGLQSVGGQAWLVVDSGASRHGVGLVYAEPTGVGTGWYAFHPLEGGRRLVGVYDALVDLGQVDLGFDLRLGGGQVYGVQLSGTGSIAIELHPRVALTASVQTGFQPTSAVRAGLGLRPVDGFELHAGVGTVLWVFEERLSPEVQPGITAKAWF